MPTLDTSVVVSVPDPTADNPSRERTFTIAGQGPSFRSYYVRIMKQRAWQALDEQASIVDPFRFGRLEAAVMRDMTAGKYEWDDEIHNSMNANRTGFMVSLQARIMVNDPMATARHAEALMEKYGPDKLTKFMVQADGPPLPNGPTPESAGEEKSMTKDSSASSSEKTQG
jgi:hypothetical protein